MNDNDVVMIIKGNPCDMLVWLDPINKIRRMVYVRTGEQKTLPLSFKCEYWVWDGSTVKPTLNGCIVYTTAHHSLSPHSPFNSGGDYKEHAYIAAGQYCGIGFNVPMIPVKDWPKYEKQARQSDPPAKINRIRQ